MCSTISRILLIVNPDFPPSFQKEIWDCYSAHSIIIRAHPAKKCTQVKLKLWAHDSTPRDNLIRIGQFLPKVAFALVDEGPIQGEHR